MISGRQSETRWHAAARASDSEVAVVVAGALGVAAVPPPGSAEVESAAGADAAAVEVVVDVAAAVPDVDDGVAAGEGCGAGRLHDISATASREAKHLSVMRAVYCAGVGAGDGPVSRAQPCGSRWRARLLL
ncbi:MAG: hypothetical protein Tsb0020_40940 [Haliangiales bacterium]